MQVWDLRDRKRPREMLKRPPRPAAGRHPYDSGPSSSPADEWAAAAFAAV